MQPQELRLCEYAPWWHWHCRRHYGHIQQNCPLLYLCSLLLQSALSTRDKTLSVRVTIRSLSVAEAVDSSNFLLITELPSSSCVLLQGNTIDFRLPCRSWKLGTKFWPKDMKGRGMTGGSSCEMLEHAVFRLPRGRKEGAMGSHPGRAAKIAQGKSRSERAQLLKAGPTCQLRPLNDRDISLSS